MRPVMQGQQAIEQAQRGHTGQQQAAPVQRGTVPVGGHTTWPGHRHKSVGHPQRGQAKRHHHKEDGAPAKQVYQHATHAGAQRRCQHYCHAEDAIGTALLMRFKRPQNDDGRNGLHHSRSQALKHPCHQHQVEVVGQAADDAAAQQQPHAGRVGAAVAIAHQQPGRGQHGHGHRHHEA